MVLADEELHLITSGSVPKKVLIDYEELGEILDILEELNNPELLRKIVRRRKIYEKTGGVPLKKLAEDLGF